MTNVPMEQEPHPSHRFGPWKSTIVLSRFGSERECECGAMDVKAGGAGSRWQADGAGERCGLLIIEMAP
jgi:hypothetical protein